MTRPGEKNISAMINPDISDQFKVHCDSVGRRQYKAVEGAIRLWLNLPNEIQSLLIDSDDSNVRLISDYLARNLREALYKALSHEEPPELPPGETDHRPDDGWFR
jgi:hypothetical protein